MKITTSTRRKFIQSIVGGAAASQVMRLLPHAAFAAGTAPKRLLCVFHPMGYLENSFWPTGDGASFTLGETQQALNPYKSKLLYVDGLLNSARAYWDPRWKAHNKDNEHGGGINGVFTGSWIGENYAASPSLDQTVANALYAKERTAHKSIALGLNAGSGTHGNAFFVSDGNPVKPMNSASQAFDTLFKNLQVQTGATPPDNTLFLRQRMLRQRVVDNARAELRAVCARVGAAEKEMCDAHLEGMSQLESRIQATNAPSAVGCTKPTAGESGDTQGGIRTRMDLIRSAFACDLSRVATLQFGGADGGIAASGLSNQHNTTHACTGATPAGGALADHKKWDAWWASQWAYLLQQLDSVKEGNGTLLDNTLIVFGSDTTTGQSMGKGAHEFYRFPLWLAGGSNFAFRTGRTVKLSMPAGVSKSQWTYHNTLLLSVARAFGLEINAFGTWDQGKGPLAALA